MNGIESLFLQLQGKVYKGSENTYELFRNFNETNGGKIREWITSFFQQKQKLVKCNQKSNLIRKNGNEAYIKGKWDESLRCYTTALSLAENSSESYTTALANRSATLYSMQEYQYSLSDIHRCLLGNCPDKLKYKILVRKIHCYSEIGDNQNREKALKETLYFIENSNSFTKEEKETHTNKLLEIKILSNKAKSKEKYECKIPEIIKNNKFPGASQLIGLRYNTKKGRHVIAEHSIQRGDVLFIEKAYITAPIFNESLELAIDKCYYCLQSNKTLIPCHHCCVCMYCDDICREKSWNETHEWECKGMLVNFWSSMGVAFPAFRLLLKNLSLGNLNIDDTNDSISSITESHELARTLTTNLSKCENILEFLILTTIAVYYLELQTNFFDAMCSKISIEFDREPKIFIGSIILKHIAQIASNASIIEHWDIADFKYVPKDKKVIATGLYPAVSMMNHSCKTNVSIFYIDDVVVVKALENIGKGEEILNCYGVDYRFAKKNQRQNDLEMQYHFLCLCEICKNPHLEIDYLDTYCCLYCSISINFGNKKCSCGQAINWEKYRNDEEEANQLLRKEILCLEDIERSYKIISSIYNAHHIKLSECYDNYKVYFLHTGEYNKASEYFNKSLEIKEMHWGNYSLKIAEEIIIFFECLKQGKSITEKLIQDEISRNLYEQLKVIFPLYYPDSYIRYDKLEILLSK